MKSKKLNNIKSSGYKTPDHYFESLEDTIFSRLAENRLSTKIKSSGFNAPDDYFESLDAKVLNALDRKDESKVILLFNWKKAAYISGFAASLIIAINLLLDNSADFTFDDLETASIQNYLLDEDLNAYDMVPYLGNTTLDTGDFIENRMNESEIEDYLFQNSDIEQLITD